MGFLILLSNIHMVNPILSLMSQYTTTTVMAIIDFIGEYHKFTVMFHF
jgi:hypothetical protein